MSEVRKPITINVGDRIESDGYYATVRYVGPLSADSQMASSKLKDIVWIGVEWDDPSRGKHDGSHAGVKYFTASSPTSGSFLRVEKCNVGVDFMSALATRYGSQSTDVNAKDLYVCGRNQQTVVTAVGLEQVAQKQSCFSSLRAISVRDLFVRTAGKPDEIAANAASVTELDMSLNLITNWQVVAAITSQMPCLESLNVSQNRLQLPQSEDVSNLKTAFGRIRMLYVNRMSYDWSNLALCLAMFSSIEQLHACYNEISRIDNIALLPFSRISLINLDGNPILDWSGILALGSLPQLTTLLANECGFASIHFPGNRCMPIAEFSSLSSLSISGNQIADWSSLDELNRLRSLTNLRFVRNPLSATAGISATRHAIIAKIAGLRYYNGAPIKMNERQGAEIDYLRAFGQSWKAAGGNASGSVPSADFLNEHPRYLDLIRIYGAPEDSEIAPALSSALKNNLISVRIVTSHEHAPLTRKLPVKMTVQRLKALVQRSFGISNPSSLRLTYVLPRVELVPGNVDWRKNSDQQNEDNNMAHIELDNDLRELSFYSVENDAIVHAEW